jgi:hypothetical protein
VSHGAPEPNFHRFCRLGDTQALSAESETRTSARLDTREYLAPVKAPVATARRTHLHA